MRAAMSTWPVSWSSSNNKWPFLCSPSQLAANEAGQQDMTVAELEARLDLFAAIIRSELGWQKSRIGISASELALSKGEKRGRISATFSGQLIAHSLTQAARLPCSLKLAQHTSLACPTDWPPSRYLHDHLCW